MKDVNDNFTLDMFEESVDKSQEPSHNALVVPQTTGESNEDQ